MSEIVLKHVYKKYRDGDAVKDFNLEIKDKEFVVFVGPSGCGKSTTLRMIAGLEKISEGYLYMDGKCMNDIKASIRDVAMVFQNYALYPHMTVYDNIAYSLKIKKVNKEDAKAQVMKVSEILGLNELLDHYPKELSGGQKQRVAFGRAIVRNPKVFLLDEPLSNLDASLRNKMRAEIAGLYKEMETTFIYVTHDQTEAMTLGTKIVVLKDGEIQQVATPYELYNKPANAFVAGFIGVPPMNFFDVSFVMREGKIFLSMNGRMTRMSKDVEEAVISSGFIEKETLLGVRAEDIILTQNPEDFASEIKIFEMLGHESWIYFDYNGKRIAAKADANSKLLEGHKINFTFDMEKVHFFEKESGKRISVK